MITLTKNGNAIVFTFSDNAHYLFDGTIEVPVNSLTLITDNSQMATFKKSASNDIFISATYAELGMSKSELESWFKENACGSTGGGGGVTSGEVETMIDQAISGKQDTLIAGSGITISGNVISSEGGNKVVELTQAQYDALVDKDPDTFYIITDAEAIDISNYYTKTAVDGLLSTKANTATTYNKTEVDTALANKADTSAVTEAISSAVSGKVNTSAYNTYTAATDSRLAEDEEVTAAGLNALNDALGDKADTSAVTASIAAAVSGKQDTLIAGSGITISGNVISSEGGGGKTIVAGRGIEVTTGATADTVSCSLPISAGTGVNSAIIGYTNSSSNWKSTASNEGAVACGVKCKALGKNSIAVGYSNTAGGSAGTNGNFAQGHGTVASGNRCHSEGLGTSATSDASHSEGYNTIASGDYSHSEGENTKATNVAEHSEGRFNVSNKANDTFGDSGNTLFSVGNGTADNARHNAFEVRQNGDIYVNDGTNDVKLQDYLQIKAVKITQAAYDALVTKDPNTLYVIVD